MSAASQWLGAFFQVTVKWIFYLELDIIWSLTDFDPNNILNNIRAKADNLM